MKNMQFHNVDILVSFINLNFKPKLISFYEKYGIIIFALKKITSKSGYNFELAKIEKKF